MKDKKVSLYIAIIFIIIVSILVIFKLANKNKNIEETNNNNIIENTNEIKNIDGNNEKNTTSDNVVTIPNEEETVKNENNSSETQNKTETQTNNKTNKSEDNNINVTSTFDESAFNNGYLEKYPAFGESYGNLIISKIGVNAPIIFGANDETILSGVGHDSGSYFPGENGSIIMCEHNYMNNFSKLGELSNGDIIEIKTDYGDFYYKKYDEQIVLETEYGKLPIQKDKEILMIYTCYPFKGSDHTQYRYVLYAEKI